MTHVSVTIQITPESKPSTPSWMGEVAAFAQVLTHTETLKAIQEQVRFARARMGTYELIDFVVVLIGYALSGEPTLLTFYERLLPFAEPFMALFGRNQLPHRSTLSRFLAALDQPTVEVLRKLFQEDLVARKPFASPGGMVDRTGQQWWVVDVDGTRATARQRALPQAESLPVPHRRFDHVCAPGYQGRKRGEVVRTHQFLGTFGGPGNGDYRGELLRAVGVIKSYATMLEIPTASMLVRLDGLYGDAAPLIDVLTADLGVVARSRDYSLLELPVVQQVLACPPDQVSTHPESAMTRAQCQESSTTLKPRRVSAVLWPLDASRSDSSPPQRNEPQELPLAPVLWRDWPRCGIRRAWLKVVRSQTVRLESSIPADPSPAPVQISSILTQAKLKHWRLSWQERLARNARPSDAPRLVVTLHGLPTTFARSFGFDLLATA